MNLTTRGFLRNEAEGKLLRFGFTALNRCGVRATSWSNLTPNSRGSFGNSARTAGKLRNCC